MKNNLAKTSFMVTAILLTGYLISFIKEASIAKYFGVSSDVDAYTIAITIPVNLFSIIAVSIQPIVIPNYSNEIYNKGSLEAKKYIDSLISIIILISLFFIGLIEILADSITFVFAPGLSTETHDLVVSLLRITTPTILFTLLDRVFIGILNVHKSFVLPALSVYFLNLSILVCIILLHSVWGIYAACVGQVVGSILQVVFLYCVIFKHYRYSFRLDLKSPSIKQTGKGVIPIMWSTSISEINAILNRIVASFLFVGAISALGYASKVNSVLMLFFTSAISTIVYPMFAESSVKKNFEQLNKRVNLTLSIYAFFLLPLMLFIIIYRSELMEVAFARGAFDQKAIEVTQSLLGCYAAGIIFLAFRDAISKVFYSLQDTKTPAVNTTIGLLINIVLSLSLPYLWGVEGLALATTFSSAFISVLLLRKLTVLHNEIELSDFVKNLGFMVIPLVLMLFGMLVLKSVITSDSLLLLITSSLTTTFIYLSCSYMLKSPVLNSMIKMIRSIKV